MDPSELLANIEEQIVKAKEISLSRKEILDRIDKWLAACEEESWLEEYNQVSLFNANHCQQNSYLAQDDRQKSVKKYVYVM